MLNDDIKIKSTELVDLINQFREQEGNKIELSHKNFMAKIKRELEILSSNGFSQLNIKPAEYMDEQNKPRPCYELNRNGMLQMLNLESAIVRYKTIQYIDNLEKEFKKHNKPVPTMTEERFGYVFEKIVNGSIMLSHGEKLKMTNDIIKPLLKLYGVKEELEKKCVEIIKKLIAPKGKWENVRLVHCFEYEDKKKEVRFFIEQLKNNHPEYFGNDFESISLFGNYSDEIN